MRRRPWQRIVWAFQFLTLPPANLNAANFLENNDSTGFFRPIGDLILCGPTQTNVNDFRVVLIDP